MNSMRALILFIALSGGAAIDGPALLAALPSFTLANTIQSNMVLQQAKPFKVWGNAIAGVSIEIQADWMQEPVCTTAMDNRNTGAQSNTGRFYPAYHPHLFGKRYGVAEKCTDRRSLGMQRSK
jgi:hypothetical protein